VTAYTDTTGRVWQGCASAADVEAYIAQERREQLGAAIRARREALGVSLRQTARAVKRSPGWLSRVELGHETPGEDALERLALRLECEPEEQSRWMALAGIIPRSLRAALCEHPERWGDVRAVLARGTK